MAATAGLVVEPAEGEGGAEHRDEKATGHHFTLNFRADGVGSVRPNCTART